MQIIMSDINGTNPGPGRPAIYGNRQQRGSFTAPAGYIEFLRRLGAEQETLSAGVRKSVEYLVSHDPRFRALMRQVGDEGYSIGNLDIY